MGRAVRKGTKIMTAGLAIDAGMVGGTGLYELLPPGEGHPGSRAA